MKAVEQRIISAAISLVKAENAARDKRESYLDAQRQYRAQYGQITEKLDPENEAHALFFEATANTYAALQKAKRKTYNARRRLRTAVAALSMKEACNG